MSKVSSIKSKPSKPRNIAEAYRHSPVALFHKKMKESLETLGVSNDEVDAMPTHRELLDGQNAKAVAKEVIAELKKDDCVVHHHTTSTQIDLTYNREHRRLTRHINTEEHSITLDERKGNKRLILLKALLTAKRGLKTTDLKESLNCKTAEAVYKVIQGLNKQVSARLNLAEEINFADGSDKGGYKIHANIAVHTE